MKFMVSFCSEHGRTKTASDDSALIGHQIINDDVGVIEFQTPGWICLCDGVGGNAGGQEASLFVTEALSKTHVPQSVEEVKALFIDINNRLLAQAQNTADHKMMATTATALFLSDESVYLAHIGNTRLYTKRGAFIQQLTVDQTTYQWLLDHGNVAAAEACNRSEITGAMGGGKPDLITSIAVEQLFERKIPSTILLTSDGIHEYLSQDEIEDILEADESMLSRAKMLCDSALDKGSDDDRSVIIVCVDCDQSKS